MDEVDDALDHRRRGVLAALPAVQSGVEAEVDAQDAVGTPQSLRRSIRAERLTKVSGKARTQDERPTGREDVPIG
jgi:hypothetical protein